MTRLRSLLALFVLTFVLVTSVLAWTYRPASAASALPSTSLLTTSGAALTSYGAGSTFGQGLCPLPCQSATGLDGVPAMPAPFGLMMGANPVESQQSCGNGKMLNNVDLAKGIYSDTVIDLALPGVTISLPIGRTNSSATSCGSPTDGYQGKNWGSFSSPEIEYTAGGSVDFVTIVTGADRYSRYERSGSTDYFHGVNGAGGVVQFEEDLANGNIYIFRDIFGLEAFFFDPDDTTNGYARGQLWKVKTPNGKSIYAGGDSVEAPSRTVSASSYHASGGPSVMFDASKRRYTFAYNATTKRLESVTVEIDPNGDHTWTDAEECGKVEYAYYTGSSTNGSDGDLGLVSVTVPVDETASPVIEQVKQTHYRYHKSGSSVGAPHELRMIVEPEGLRNYYGGGKQSLTTLDGLSDASIEGYASARFEYDSGRIDKAWFAGECGCGGGSSGAYEISYGTNSNYTNTSAYDTAWAMRAIVERPDGTFRTQYFDEFGQPLSSVITSHEPGTTPTPPATMETWATRVERDSDGLLVREATPANASSYNHSDGTITPFGTAGLVNVTERRTTSDALEGFAEMRVQQVGETPSAGKTYPIVGWSLVTQSTGGTHDVVRPYVEELHGYYGNGKDGNQEYDEFDVTSFDYLWHDDSGDALADVQIEAMRTTYPAVPTSQNGSGTALVELAYFNDDQQLEYSKATDGVISQVKYDDYGRPEEAIEDVDYSETGSADPLSGVTGWSLSMEGDDQYHHTTSYTYDCVGRSLETTLPSGRVTKNYYSVTDDDRLVALRYPRYETGGTPKYYGPIDFTISNHAGRVEDSGRVSIDNSVTRTVENDTQDLLANHVDESKANATELFGLMTRDDVVRLRRSVYNDTGTKRIESHLYFDVPPTGMGTEGTNYDATYFHHDSMGRQVRVEEPSGTIYRTDVDTLGRPASKFIGTDDTNHETTQASPWNMVVTELIEYDDGNDGGNSLVTTRTERTTGTTSGERVTELSYDDRDRLAIVEAPTSPHTLSKLDYRGRRVATGLYSDLSGKDWETNPVTTSSDRLALSEQAYDVLGQVYETTRHQVDTSDGSKGSSLVYDTWYDAAGRILKHRGASLTKTTYDRLGRVFNEFDLAWIDDGAGDDDYSAADDVDNDLVLEQRQIRYDDESNVIMTATIYRHPTDRGASETTGALDENSESPDPDDLALTYADVLGRAHITAHWYDLLGRRTTTSNYGTYGDATFDRDGLTEPTASGDSPELRLVTTYTYGGDGSVRDVNDENGIFNSTERDDAGRVVAEIRNYQNGVPDKAYPDQDIIVAYEYENGLRTKYIADVDETDANLDDQETVYEYSTTSAAGPDIYAGHLLQRVIYPDGDTSTDNVSYEYNVQGEQIKRTDQAGNVLERIYDDGGRLLDLEATTINTGDGFDDYVKKIVRQYDDLGRTSYVTQYGGTPATTVRDQVGFTYDDWGMREDFVQNLTHVIGGGGTDYTVSNEWEANTGSDRRQAVRLKKQTYPSGKYVEPVYSSGSPVNLHDNEASRVSALRVDGSTKLSYEYLGSSWVVETDYLGIDVERKLHDGATWPTSAPDYDALDSLGRTVNDRWTQYTSSVTFYNVDVTYQSAKNLIASIEDHVNTGFDVDYTHDGAARLKSVDEGERSGTITTHRYEEWVLDPLGNWRESKLNLNNDSDYTDTDEYDELRVHNDANEITERDEVNSVPSPDQEPDYDAVGNLTDDDENYIYKYDVFGRQVSVLNQSSTAIANYRYNGLGYLVQEQDVAASEWTKSVFDGSWRVLAKYVGSALIGDPTEEYVYHRAGSNGLGGSSYIDLVAMRDRDTDASGDLDEGVYYCQDRLANVVVLLEDSGSVLEWVGYSAYGVPFMTPPGDMDGDGTVTAADLATIATAIGNNEDPVKADMHLDGDVTSADGAEIRSKYKGLVFGSGKLSAVQNDKGFMGYLALEPLPAHWLGRNRVLNAKLGRWGSRDPLGYVDGPSVYEFALSDPSGRVDPMGTQSKPLGEDGFTDRRTPRERRRDDRRHRRRGEEVGKRTRTRPGSWAPMTKLLWTKRWQERTKLDECCELVQWCEQSKFEQRDLISGDEEEYRRCLADVEKEFDRRSDACDPKTPWKARPQGVIELLGWTGLARAWAMTPGAIKKAIAPSATRATMGNAVVGSVLLISGTAGLLANISTERRQIRWCRERVESDRINARWKCRQDYGARHGEPYEYWGEEDCDEGVINCKY
jgi:dockerin type I repeat protein